MSKTCSVCLETKEEDQFRKGRRQCISCYKIKAAYRDKVYRDSRVELLKAKRKLAYDKAAKSVKNKTYYSNNKLTILSKTIRYANKTKKAKASYDANYRVLNRAKRNAAEYKRRAKILRATPSWANESKILDFYETAEGLRMLLGEFYSVDHIVPLQSEFVCGLHCEANLRIVTRSENSSKNNKWWPDMWSDE